MRQLGGAKPSSVEIVRFEWQAVIDRLIETGCTVRLRLSGSEPFTTWGGTDVANCDFPDIADAAVLEARPSAIVGVVKTGLFISMASTVVVGRSEGVEVLGL